MTTLTPFDPQLFLVQRKFPQIPAAHLFGETLPRQMSPNPKMVAEIERRRALATSYIEQLSSLAKEDFDKLLETETANFYREIQEKEDEKERQRFFNFPNATADFDYWSRAAHWSLEEAVALSFRKEPAVVNAKKLQPIAHESAFALRYIRLLELARRAVPWQKLFDPVLPGIFIAWAKQNEIEFPIELENLVVKRGNNIINWKDLHDTILKLHEDSTRNYEQNLAKLYEAIDLRDKTISALQAKIEQQQPPPIAAERDISTRERESLLKLVIGMAVNGYGYVPSAARSEKVSEIANDLQRSGVALDADTVRKWLRMGAELLPPKQDE